MSYHRYVVIDHVDKEFPLENCDNFSINTHYTMRAEQKEMDYIMNFPDFEKERYQEFIQNGWIYINSWSEYAVQSSHGRVNSHFAGVTECANQAVATPNKCIHNQFEDITQCIDDLFDVLYGSPFHFRLFKEQNLCYDCLLCLCSQKERIKKLFADWTKEYTNFNFKDSHRTKELFYLSNTLLKYQLFVKYVLSDSRLYQTIFYLFIYYLKLFKRINYQNNDNGTQRNQINVVDKGYMLCNDEITTLYLFEYNFVSIISAIIKLMPYFKRTHLCALIKMKYFVYYKRFISEYLKLKHHEILLNDITFNTEYITVLGTFPLITSLAVIGFINHQIAHKISTNLYSDRNSNNIIIKIKKWYRNMCNYTLEDMRSWFDINGHLTNKYAFLEYTMKSHRGFSVKNIIKNKCRQIRKYIQCGNSVCIQMKKKKRKFRLCSRCKLVYYCSKKCQKIHWIHHKVMCKLFV